MHIPQALSPDDDTAKNKEIAAVSYTLILAPILLFGRKESPFIQFHAKQGSVLLVVAIIFWFIPYIGRFLELIVVALALLGFFHAAQGKRYELPFIYAILQKDFGVQRLKAEWHKIFPHQASVVPQKPSSEPEKRYDFPHINQPHEPSL